MRGLFITFEGPDGSGKSTQIKLLCKFLTDLGLSFVMTREPGGTKIGESIRTVILNPGNVEMADETEMLLYAASRAQHVAEVIRPALMAGKIVISDRFLDSSIAYQGGARGLGDVVADVNKHAVGDCTPDLTFLLLADAGIGLERISRGKSVPDRIESEAIAYHEAVVREYRKIAAQNPKRTCCIDATQPIGKIAAHIADETSHLIEKHGLRGCEHG